MKKLVLVLLVAMLSVPAFAAPVIKLLPGGSNMVDVYVDANSGPLASGIGIIAKATGGNITAVTNFKTNGESTSASKGYGIFPGQITFDGGGVPAYNTPVGQCDIDPNGLGTPNVGLEFGALYKHTVVYPAVDPNAPLAYTRLCTLTVSSGVTKVDVVGNIKSCGPTVPGGTIPAGIITEGALGTYAVNASISLAEPDPYAGTCWDPTECPGQAYGDSNCDGAINLDDLIALKKSWGKTFSDPHGTGIGQYNCCSDFNKTGVSQNVVNLDDLIKLKQNWGNPPAGSSTGNQQCPTVD